MVCSNLGVGVGMGGTYKPRIILLRVYYEGVLEARMGRREA